MDAIAPSPFRRISILSVWLLIAARLLCGAAFAQFTYSEDFKNSTAPGWVLNPAGNSTPNVTLTSGAATRTGDPETGGTIDPSGSGWLRLTNDTNNTHNAVYFDTPIPSAGNQVNVTFGMNLWGGNQYNSTGADGLTFFLYDASKPFQVGADGGSIGYAQKTGVNGLNGGYVAVALDAYGNFSVAAEGRTTGTGSLQPNTVAARGPGQGTTGYDYLGGATAPYTMAFDAATTRPNQSTQYRNVSITLSETNQLSVSLQFGEDGLWHNLLNLDLGSFVRPEQLKMGFSAGTGSGTIITEVGGLLQVQATAGSGNFIWDNRNGPSDTGVGNSVWGTGATDPLNWAGQTNPTAKSNVVFNSTYINTAQNIDVLGSDKTITNLYFSGPNGYTLGSTESRKLVFDSATAGGLTAINITADAGGDSAHNVTLGIQMNQNLDINHTGTANFTISGDIATGGKALTSKGTGTTILSGAISGTGTLVKSDTGTTVVSGSTTNTYTGATTISGGTLQIEKATALGSTTAGTTVSSGGTLALAGSGTTFAAEALSLSGTGVNDTGALLNAAGNNTWQGNITLAGASSIGAAAATTLTVNGGISGSAALTKVGDGTLTLNGTNTYTGATNILAGTVAITSESKLGANPGSFNAAQLNLDGGTLRTQTSAVTINDSNRGVTIGAAGGTFDTQSNLTISNVLTGSGNLTKTGGSTLVLSGTNTHTGNILISAGTLTAQNGSAIGNNATVTVAAGATLNPAGYSETIGALTGAGNVTLTSGSTTTLTVGNNNDSTTFSGVIAGGSTNALAKTGTGNLTLTGANTLSGNVTVSNGGLVLNNAGSGALGSAANITVATGATVALGASNQINDSANLILSGGTFATGGFSDTLRQLSQTTDSTIDYLGSGGILRFNGVTSSVSGLGTLSGTLSIANWAGSISGGGGEQLVVYSTSGAPTVSGITFLGWGGATTIDRSATLGAGFYEIVPLGTASYWDVNGNGNWNANNWATSANVTQSGPNGADLIAILGNTVTGNNTFSPLTTDPTVTMNSNRTVGKLIFENSANRNYTISGGSRLDFSVSSGQAQIIVNDNGSHSISNTPASPNRLNDTLLITNNSNQAVGLDINAGLQFQNSGDDLIVNGTGNTRIDGAITRNGTLTGNDVLKTGTGSLVLSNTTNSYTGNTTVANGTLIVEGNAPSGATGALGNSTQAVIVNDATTSASMNTSLLIGAAGVTVGRNVAVGAQGGTTTLGGNFASGNATFSGSVTLDKSVTLTAAGTSNVTFSGQLIDGTGTTSITKAGTGTVILGSTANNYDGTTTINAGTLRLGAAGVVPDGSALTVATGATFDLNGFSETIGSLAGSGNVTGSSNAITLVAGGNNASTTFSGIISDGAGTLGLTKAGAGTLTLTGANTYDGATLVSGGTLIAAHNTALGTGTGTSTTVSTGATLGLQGNITVAGETLNAAAATAPGTASVANLAGTNTWTGAVSLTGSTANDVVRFDAASGSQLTLSGAVGEATNAKGFVKTGTGTIVLSGANSYTGTTNVTAGTLVAGSNTALGTGTASTSVQVGATLGVQNSISVASSTSYNLYGTTTPSTPSIQNVSGSNTLAGAVTLNGGASTGVAIDASAGSLTLNGVISQATNPNYLVKTGSGNVTLGGTSANTFTGGLQVADGTVLLNKTAGQNATGSGNVSIGNGIGAANTAVLKLLQNEQIANTRVTIASDGKFDVNGLTETIGSFAGTGTIATGTGGTGLLIAGGDNTSTTFGGALTGDGTIRKTGSGTLTFNQSINFANGTLELNGGTIALGTTGAGITLTVGTLYITGNTVLDFGNSAASILDATNIRFAPGATLSIANWVDNVDFFFAHNWLAGTLPPGLNTRGVGDATQITFTPFSNTSTAWLDYNNGAKHQITPTPEPATYGAIMMGAAVALLGYRRWRNKKG